MILRIALAAVASGLVATAALAATGPAPPKPSQGVTCSLPASTPQPSTATPSQALLDALGVLRRPRTADDAVPAAAFARIPSGGPVMLDAARRVRPSAWLVPLENILWFPTLPERCLRKYPAAERERIRREQREAAARPPVEGVEIVTQGGQALFGRWRLADIQDGKTFRVDNCGGPQRDQLQVSGLVPDGVGKVTITARDGSVTEATPDQNLAVLMYARPAKVAGLPAHVTLGARTVALRADDNLVEACSTPNPVGNGFRLDAPIPLARPAGAKIELATRRWEAEDTLPLLAGATYRRAGSRCLMIASRAQLKRRPPKQRFCVSDARMREQRYVAHVRRLPGGQLVLEGFADRRQVTYITIEHAPGGGAMAIWPARGSGAFFLAVRAGIPGRAFALHAALRGKPVRYTGLKRISGG